MENTAKPSLSEITTFAIAGLCVVLGLIIAPMNGGLVWVPLAIAALLAWQGMHQRSKRIRAARA